MCNNAENPAEKILKKLAEKKPEFIKFIDENGLTPVFEYYKKTEKEHVDIFDIHKKLALEIIYRHTKDRLGETIAENFINDFQKFQIIGTADHHGIVTSPFFLNNIIIEALLRKRAGIKTLPILSCGNVPIDNTSYPRGVLFTNTNTGDYEKIPLTSLRDKHLPVYLRDGFTKTELKKFENKFKKIFNNHNFSDEFFRFLYDNTLEKDFKIQVTKINNFLIKKLFPGIDLIYIDQESIVINLLIEYHIPNKTYVNHLFTDEKILQSFIKNFNHIQGAFDIQKNKGSILFWYIKDKKKLRIVDYKNGFILETGEVLKVNIETLSGMLKNGLLVPTMALCFIVLSFYHGIECAGGFSQICYLPEMEKAFTRMANEYNWNIKITTKNNIYRGDLAVINQRTKNDLRPATLIDVLKHYPINLDILEKAISYMNIKEAVFGILTELYKEVEKISLPSSHILHNKGHILE